MNKRHGRTRTAVGAAAAAAGLTAAALVAAPPVAASPAGSPAAPPRDAGTLAAQLTERLGARTAGAYLDASTRELVVTVTDAAAARAVRAAGAEPRKVERSGADLKSVMAELRRDATIPGTAWAIDPASNQVVLTMDASVTGTKLRKVEAEAAEHGAAVRTERVPGKFRKFTAGGEAIHTGSARCSLGFNVRSGSEYYFLTAGHCTEAGGTWTDGDGRTLGQVAGSSFPGDDYGLVRYTSTPRDSRGTVHLYGGTQDITRAGNATVGQTVTRSGSTTGVHEGRVTALDQTVNYQEGSVSGLIRTTVCAEPGDSGGSLFAGSTALGLTSGGSGACWWWWGSTTFFQPVTEPLSRYGVSVY